MDQKQEFRIAVDLRQRESSEAKQRRAAARPPGVKFLEEVKVVASLAGNEAGSAGAPGKTGSSLRRALHRMLRTSQRASRRLVFFLLA